MTILLRLQLILAAAAILVTVLLATATYKTLSTFESADLTKPDFAAFIDVREKKQAFFTYLKPKVQLTNEQILLERAQLINLAQKENADLSTKNQRLLDALSNRYSVNLARSNSAKITELLERVDIVPASLALAQAAKESGWGTSRFAREGNNYFGQWCFTSGCGLIPQQRNADAIHEVRKFASTQNSVDAYALNLNTHTAYQDLRESRANLRAQGTVNGATLAAGLSRYSERGDIYVDEIRAIIRINKLSALDQPN